MAHSDNGEFLWNEFYQSFIEGGYNEFKYKDKYINVGVEIKRIFHKTEKWVFVVHRHDNTGPEIYSEYKTPQLLLDNARIEGKLLQEIWDELILCD